MRLRGEPSEWASESDHRTSDDQQAVEHAEAIENGVNDGRAMIGILFLSIR